MGKIKPGMQAEHKRRHDAIWPEMRHAEISGHSQFQQMFLLE